MKPEDKYPTVEQCKRLVELGVVLDTEKYWKTFNDGDTFLVVINQTVDPTAYLFPAPDVAELGEALRGYSVVRIQERGWRLWKTSFAFSKVNDFINYKTEAQARCAALIWLIEQGYIKTKGENIARSVWKAHAKATNTEA